MNAAVNGKIIVENILVADRVLLFEDKIIDIIPESEFHKFSVNHVYDAMGRYVSSGFIL